MQTSGKVFDVLENVQAYPARGHTDFYTPNNSILESQ
jgi:hypothetical protein